MINSSITKKDKKINQISNYISVHVTDKGREIVSFKHIVLAKEIMEELPIINSKFGFFYYNEDRGIWIDGTKKMLEKKIQSKLEDYSVTKRITETFQHIDRETYEDSSEDPFEKNPYLINFSNGVYDIKTAQFEPHNELYYQRIQIPIIYDENAECSKINAFLDSILEPEEKQFFIEWVGYGFVKSYADFQNFLVLYGPGKNGKSTLLKLVQLVIGKTNVSNLTLKSIENNRFAAANLYLKSVNVFADINNDDFDSAETIKAITGDDDTQGEFKGENVFFFRNFAKLIFSANRLPNFRDTTPGFKRRPLILPLDRVFQHKEGEGKRDIIAEIATPEELSGFALSCLKAIASALEKGKLSITTKMQEATDKWLGEMDNVLQFTKEACVVHENVKVGKQILFNEYKQWCDQSNCKPLGKNNFYKKIEELYPTLKDKQPPKSNFGEARPRYYEGIALLNYN